MERIVLGKTIGHGGIGYGTSSDTTEVTDPVQIEYSKRKLSINAVPVSGVTLHLPFCGGEFAIMVNDLEDFAIALTF